jgi:hypothetical protein
LIAAVFLKTGQILRQCLDLIVGEIFGRR